MADVEPSARLTPGARLGDRYVLVSPIARGGMGEVWRARADDGTLVAIKVVLPSPDGDLPTRRLAREIETTRAFDDPNVVRLLDAGALDDGSPFSVMELLTGTSLKEYLAGRPPLAAADALDLVLQIAAGVSVAHEREIVHRDLKPTNVMVSPSEGGPLVKVLDFGIAKIRQPLTELTELTHTRDALGSPGFMAPEQLRDAREVDARADIWALGQILYRALTGRPSFDAKHAAEYFAMIASEAPTPIEAHRADLPPGLAAVVMRCLERDPERRFASLAALARALHPFADVRGAASVERIVARLGEPPAEADDGDAERTVTEQRPRGGAVAAVPASRSASPSAASPSMPASPSQPARSARAAARGRTGLAVVAVTAGLAGVVALATRSPAEATSAPSLPSATEASAKPASWPPPPPSPPLSSTPAEAPPPSMEATTAAPRLSASAPKVRAARRPHGEPTEPSGAVAAPATSRAMPPGLWVEP